nr:ATP-dependent helicase [Treponema sp.]
MTEELNEYISALNEEQKAAVLHEGSPLLILAGAGSGKTRVITTKIAYLISEKKVDPWSILAVTFTKKAANEMKERTIQLEPQEDTKKVNIRTFHSFGSWFLRKFGDYSGLGSNFTVYDDNDTEVLIKKAVPSISNKEAKLAAHQIALAKDLYLSPEDDLSGINSELELNAIYSAYEKRLRATGNLDFGDLIMLPIKLIESNAAIRHFASGMFKVLMVDEYQDTNISQYKLLQTLYSINNNPYTCVVGDDDQSIYKFRGAEVKNILTFPEKFPGTEIIRLEKNYRSTSRILNAANMVVKKNKDRLDKNLLAARGDGNQPILAFLGDQNEETKFCADLIKASVENGASYSDWALLYRTNAQSLGFEKEFIHRKIPYVVVGSLKFYEREEIKDSLAYLSLCANPRDEISFRRVINKPSRGIGEKTQDLIMESAISSQT